MGGERLYDRRASDASTASSRSSTRSRRSREPWRERAEAYLTNPKQVHWIVEVGTSGPRTAARETMRDVRAAMAWCIDS